MALATLALLMLGASASRAQGADAGSNAEAETTPGHAAPTAGHEAEAQAAMQRGIAATAAGDQETALEEYRRASELVPDANLPYLYAAQALESLGRMQEATQSYETYLKKNPYVHDAASIQARVRRLRAQYIDASLSVSCMPEGAQVFLDDGADPVGTTPMVKLPLRAGEHHVVVRLEGYDPIDTRLRLAAGTSTDLPCTLVKPAARAPSTASPGGTAAATRPPPPSTPRDTASHPKRTWGFVALGSGAALVLGSAIVDATWLDSTIDDFHAAAASGDGSALGLQRRAHALQTTLVVTYVAGGVLLATGAGLVLWDWRAAPASSPGGSGARATLSTDGRALLFRGSF